MSNYTRFSPQALASALLAVLLLWGGGSGTSMLLAGGSGLNVVVVVNQASSNSLALGNYYCEQRQIPPENVLRIFWTGGNTTWSGSQFKTNLYDPLLAMLTQRQLTNQIDYVVLSMDIPFSVVESNAVNGTTSVLFYGFKSYSTADLRNATNSYAGSERIFHQARPASAPGASFLATMITSDSLTRAKQIVDQGRLSDSTFPTQTIVLAKSSDPLRNLRYRAFDNAIFNSRLGGRFSVVRMDSDSPWGKTNMAGYATGLANFSVSPNAFVPGAMADSLTSFGGILFGFSGQTSLLAFMNAGASASYGTVTEPQPAPEKFPDPQNFFYQTRGFSLAECYYLSLTNPYQGLVVGEPLGAPFARLATGGWIGLATNAVLSGQPHLTVNFTAQDPERPLHRVDVFLNGKYLQTITNLAPQAGNVLSLDVNGQQRDYVVSSNATLASVAGQLANLLNDPLTQVAATVHGDRIGMQSLAAGGTGETTEFVDEAAAQALERHYIVESLAPATAQVRPMGFNVAGRFQLQVNAPAGMPYTIQASSDLKNWLPVFRHASGGPIVFEDAFAHFYPQRYYRVAPSLPGTSAARLVSRGRDVAGRFKFYVEAAYGSPYVVQASTNLVTWSVILTNVTGGPAELVDEDAPKHARRFYRLASTAAKVPPRVRALGRDPNGAFLMRVEAAADTAYVIEASTNLTQWLSVHTNAAGGSVDFAEANAAHIARRFYRARVLGPASGLNVTIAGKTGSGGNILSVNNPSLSPFVILASTNQTTWSPIFTNLNPAAHRISVSSAAGSADLLTTHLRVARPSFLDTCAHGQRQFRVSGTIQAGSFLRLTVSKTNATQFSLAVTNHTDGGTILALLQQLTDLINQAGELAGADGLVADDLVNSAQGAAVFNLRARSPGLAAAGIIATFTNSPGLTINPSSSGSLTANLPDLRPRNHLFVTTGRTTLTAAFTLNTLGLPDGYHELTAVAYEGSQVHTQTRRTVPVRVQNRNLSATLTLGNGATSTPVSSTLRFVVSANSGNITELSLHSTGGLIGSVAGTATHEFTVPGSVLGAGLHPFYALVKASNGAVYRTETVRVPLTP